MIIEWESIRSNNELVAILAEGGKHNCHKVLGRVFDLKKWFRQLGVTEEEYWKACAFATQMGQGSSAKMGTELLS